MAESGGLRRNPEVEYERRDLSLFAIAMVAIGIVVLLGLAPLIIIGAFPLTRGDVDRRMAIVPPEPRLQTAPQADLAAYLAKERKLLDSYGWVDRARGIVHIPIEEAMRRAARTGLPGFPPAPPAEQPHPREGSR